jgi:DNA-binding transcriptional MerR regulator
VSLPGDIFSAGEASRLCSVSWRVLDSWAKTDFLTPSIRQARGTGSRRTYSFADLVALSAVQKLRTAGIELGTLKPIVTYLQQRDHLEQTPAGTLLVLERGAVREEKAGDAFSRSRLTVSAAETAAAPVWHLLDLSAVVERLKSDIDVMRRNEAVPHGPSPRRHHSRGERGITPSGSPA